MLDQSKLKIKKKMQTTKNKCDTRTQKDEILDQSKLKEFAGKKVNVKQKWKFVLVWFENILRKGENAGNQHFLPFPQYFLLRETTPSSMPASRFKYNT